MSKDKRVKGCPSTGCEMHEKKIKQSADNMFCPKCGTKLVYVCKKCFSEIEDTDAEHRICARCEAEAEEKKKDRIEKAKTFAEKGVGMVVAVGGPIVIGVAGDVLKKGEKAAVNKGAKIVMNGIQAAAKKVIKK